MELDMDKSPHPTPSELRKLLRYDSESGKLYWRHRTAEMFSNGGHTAKHIARRFNKQFAGCEAFTATDAAGYKVGAVWGQLFKAHRVAWAIERGEWPEGQIDHINGDRADNRIANLRVVTNRENSISACRPKNNTTGFTGVSRHRGRFRAQIKINGKQKFLGYFDDPEDAYSAYCEAKLRYGFAERHGNEIKRRP